MRACIFNCTLNNSISARILFVFVKVITEYFVFRRYNDVSIFPHRAGKRARASLNAKRVITCSSNVLLIGRNYHCRNVPRCANVAFFFSSLTFIFFHYQCRFIKLQSPSSRSCDLIAITSVESLPFHLVLPPLLPLFD